MINTRPLFQTLAGAAAGGAMVAVQAAADLRLRRGAPRPRCAGIVAISVFVSLKPICRHFYV